MPRGAAVYVLDAESTDDTVALARRLGAAAEVRPWRGFIDARRFALARVVTPWTLFLDADERLDIEIAAAIEAAPTAGVDGYALRRATTLCGKPVRACGWSDERLLRLVRTRSARVQGSGRGNVHDVHERIVVDGRIGRLGGRIIHDSYPTVASYREKFERYTDIEASTRRPDPLGLAAALLLVPVRLVWGYVRWGGFLDGWRGAFVAWNSARYAAVVKWKALRR